MQLLNEFLLQVIITLTNIGQIVAGFGGSIIAIPFAVRLIDFSSAKMVLNTYSEIGCAVLMAQTFKEINWKEFCKMTVSMAVGMAAGWAVVSAVNLDFLMPFYAVFIIALGIYKLTAHHEIRCGQRFILLIALFAGFIHGLFLSGGCMLVVYATMAVKDKKEFRATLNAVWVVIGFAWMVYDYVIGNFTTANVIRSLIGVATLGISIPAGNYLFTRLDQGRLLKVVYTFIVIAGITLLI